MKSIVSGIAEFPADALPPTDEGGHQIDVVFASDAFEPRIVNGVIWLPEKTGRSHPVIDGTKQEKAGPIALRLLAPKLGRAGSQVAHGRLGLYFKNNLLQSAAVRVTVSGEANSNQMPNKVDVDFVLTGGFRDIESLSTRDVEPSDPAANGKGEPIGLNLTLNDDGGGTHRIIVPELKGPVGFNYNPVAAGRLLADARTELQGFFFKRDGKGNFVFSGGDKVLGLDPDNGKSYEGFCADLFDMAQQGGKLFGQLFKNVIPTDGRTQAQVISDLREAVAGSTVIQVARTGSADYVFPWSFVYDFELSEPDPWKLKYCDVVKEWKPSGRRRGGSPSMVCPKGDHSQHVNTICPFGFWGMRHRIEQPPSLPLPSAEKGPQEKKWKIKAGKTLVLYAARTADVKLDSGRIESHLGRLTAINKITFTPPIAQDWDGVSALLKSPQAVYFLCHGEYDTAQREPYLGIGLRDAQLQHRIYPSSLAQLLTSKTKINQDGWANTNPLIFINGCHTTDQSPTELWDFVSKFNGAGASVIGTEVSILLAVATEVAELLFASLAKGTAVTDAIRSMRWELANRGNLLGLAYTPYSYADLSIEYAV